MYTTFTPLTGLSSVILKFLPEGQFPENGKVHDQDDSNLVRYVVNCDWDDVPHLNEDSKRELLASYTEMERDARSRGIPSIGSGSIYPVIWEDHIVEPFQIPLWFKKAYGMDFGWNRTACVWIAQDPDTKIMYVYSEHYVGKQTPPVHAQAIKERGDWLIGVCDPAGGGSSQRDGTQLIDEYVGLGLLLEPGNNAIIAGLARTLSLLQSNQLKIFSSCKNLLNELRIYRYDETGKPAPKQADHAPDALRYLVMGFDDVASEQPDPDAQQLESYVGESGRNPITGY